MPYYNRLNLGSGKDYKIGYINCDKSHLIKTDEVFNIENGIPFEDNSFNEILANNVLEQVSHPQIFVYVMNEIWRVLKPDGKLIARVPNAKDICAFQDTFDILRFTDQSFTYMEYGHRRYETYGKHYGYKPFKVKLIEDNGRQLTFELQPVK